MSASEIVKVPAWTVKLLPILGALGLGYATWATTGWMDEFKNQQTRNNQEMRAEMKSVVKTVGGIEREMSGLNLAFNGQISALDKRASDRSAGLDTRLVKVEALLDAALKEVERLRRRKLRNTHDH